MDKPYTREMAAQYQVMDPDQINGWWKHFLGNNIQSVLEIGPGSGRDARWIRERCPDANITLVEPDPVFHEFLPTGDGWRLIQDSLPELNRIINADCRFDLIVLNAVFMHVAPTHRSRVFRKLTSLMRPGGHLVIQTKLNHPEPERQQYSVVDGELQRLAIEHGWVVAHESVSDDASGRNIAWGRYVLRLPDDSTGSLPLLRRIVITDNKSSSYKLGLLRVLCKLASEVPGCARIDESYVTIPAGLVGLYWLRMYVPLINANVPQSPVNTFGGEKLAFANNPSFAQIKELPAGDFLLGVPVADHVQSAMCQSIAAAVNNIAAQPVKYIKLEDSTLFEVRPPSKPKPRVLTQLIPEQLDGFGEFRLPVEFWRALRAHEVWIEPTIISNWQRLSTGWLANQKRNEVKAQDVAQAFMWSDLSIRDTSIVSRRVEELHKTSCVWTSASVTPRNLNVDHALPFAHWPCNQLWNLLPTTQAANRSKSDRIPTSGLLDESKYRIQDWWKRGFLEDEFWHDRFWVEAHAGLPALRGSTDTNDLFEALCLQAERLRSEYRLRSWRP